ncbi:MAG TPA: carboxypeptidase-like regulatory domain-containing protein, partial [Anseongella sp.]|nr:carboxypeptidase-like regulatory domain-containing protein [Anseongella sp.]
MKKNVYTLFRGMCATLLQLVAFGIFTSQATADAAYAPPPQKTVSGTVVSATDGMPLPGVSVMEKGSQAGASTDISGNFSITVSTANPVLVFSFLGFRTEEVTVTGDQPLRVSLAENTEALDVAVVTALGIKREKRSLGYSVGNVDGEALTETPQTSVLNALSGKVAGVQISQMDGTAGSSVNMVIR